MANGLNSVKTPTAGAVSCKSGETVGKTGAARRIFAPHFKLQVLDSYRHDVDCKGNQRATARKYGIHRRQIQKWLQVEHNLRSTVCKNNGSSDEMALRISRLQDATASDGVKPTVEVRVPAAPSQLEVKPVTPPHTPLLDFTSPSVATSHSVSLSYTDSPIDLSLKKMNAVDWNQKRVAPVVTSTPPCLPTPTCQPDVWDLSTKRKLEQTTNPPVKTVKLFKPYLDDVKDEPITPCCSNSIEDSNTDYYYNYNNNLCCEIKAEYTIHELQPKPTYHTITPYQLPEYDTYYCQSFDSEMSNVSNFRQRQSYSLDFKLSAIDCYHEDSLCKGNQRAVALKYNIHRRQVQKWLKREDELRSKNEFKQMVR